MCLHFLFFFVSSCISRFPSVIQVSYLSQMWRLALWSILACSPTTLGLILSFLVSLSFSCSVSILLPAVPPQYEALSVFEVRSVLRPLGPDCSSSFSSYMSPGFGENKTPLSFSFWSQVGPLHFPVTTYWLIQVLLFSASSDTTFIAPSFFCTNVNTMAIF